MTRLLRPNSVRLASHLAIWVVLLVPTIVELVAGWRPTDDDATISLRSYEVLSLHPPAVGQLSTISFGAPHPFFDPGPLQYWLLALPVRIDPSHGALWGAALCYGVVLSLAVEALWRTGRWLGCALLAFTVLDVAWRIPDVLARLPWNPTFGLVFLLATMVFAWVVATGALGWWPVLVVTASISAQTELFYAGVAVALVVVSVLLGVARVWPRRDFRWAFVGVLAGFVCWLAPLIQELAGSPGNLSAIVDEAGRLPGLGTAFGFRALGMAASPRPLWMLGNTADFFRGLIAPTNGYWTLGVAVLALLIAIGVAAWFTSQEDLMALAGITVVSTVAVVVTMAGVPGQYRLHLVYLIPALWLIAIGIWSTVLWGVWELVGWIHASLRKGVHVRYVYRYERLRYVGWAALGMAGAVTIVLTMSVLSQSSDAQVLTAQVRAVERISHSVETELRPGPLVLDFRPPPSFYPTFVTEFNDGAGVGFSLTAAGYRPSLPRIFRHFTGIIYPEHSGWPRVRVTLDGGKVTAIYIRRGVRSPAS